MKTHVLYNPLAHNRRGEEAARKIEAVLPGAEIDYTDVTRIADIVAYLKGISAGENVILCGGDGTLNHFVNDLGDYEPTCEVYCYATGSGNDFFSDVAPNAKDKPFRINDYIKNLPVVSVNGMERKFINGIGYGIDGYCCEVGDKLQAESDEAVNYTAIAIKGLLFHFHPANARVTVDGKTTEWKKVWLAPTMNGKCYGGGMHVAPAQDRLNPERTLSTVLMYGSGKLKTLMVFPSIFKGEHIAHTEMVEVLQGSVVTVAFDRPCALQIDGETVLGVTEYTVRSAAALRREAEKAAEATVQA